MPDLETIKRDEKSIEERLTPIKNDIIGLEVAYHKCDRIDFFTFLQQAEQQLIEIRAHFQVLDSQLR